MRQLDEIYDIPGSQISPPKSTLISIVPFPINEFKPGLIPGQFDLPACEDGRPVCKIIGESIHYVYIDRDRGSMRVMNPSYTIARSIVNDYNSAQLASGLGCHPGFFWAVGEWNTDSVEEKLKDKLDIIREIQYTWFTELVKLADDDWEKTRQHYCISDVQRHAARSIDPENKQGRPWIMKTPTQLLADQTVDTIICPACGSDIPADVIICKYCSCILDADRYSKLAFARPDSVSIAQAALKRSIQ